MAFEQKEFRLVHDLLTYDPETGIFRWKRNARNRCRLAGDIAGADHPDGYKHIWFCGGLVLSHRLAWLYIYGEWPASQLDHINGDRADNRICNLRLATNGQNRANSRTQKSQSGIKGVRIAKNGAFHACIRSKGKTYHLGTFLTIDGARTAYAAAAAKMHGEFARP